MAKAARSGTLETDIDALFQLPPAEFTRARNALAGRLKKAGRTEEAERVKGLLKPSMPAWAVNQVYWRQRAAFDRLLAAGERFRAAQAAQLKGKSADLRGALDARRTTLAELIRLALATLRDGGHTPTPDTIRRVTTTLEALSTYGTHPEAPRAGRLTDEVDPPGFETLAALVPVSGDGPRGSGPPKVLSFQPPKRKAKAAARDQHALDPRQMEQAKKEQKAAARTALQAAERSVRDARVQAKQAEEALKQAAAKAKTAERGKADAERRLEQASADADKARLEARKVAAAAEEAAQAVADAERALDAARKDLERLEA